MTLMSDCGCLDRFQWFINLTSNFKNGIILTWIGTEPVVTINKPQYMEVNNNLRLIVMKSVMIYNKEQSLN